MSLPPCRVCRRPGVNRAEHRGVVVAWCDDHVPHPVERWRPVGGAPGYLVSSHGRVRGPRGHELAARPNTDGHLRVVLSLGRGRRRDVFVHTLVLQGFVGCALPGQQCCHHDDDPANNRVENLRWDVPRGNARDRKRNGRQGRSPGEQNGAAVLVAADVAQIKGAAKCGAKTKDLAKRYGVSARQIRNVLVGKNWSRDA